MQSPCYTRYETSIVRESLAVDEYVLLKESGVTLYKDNAPDAIGDLFLTNKRIIILGSETDTPRVFDRNYSYPLKKISHVEIKTEKVLLFTNQYLQITYDGKLRKFNLPEKTIKTWMNTIIKSIQDS